ncbi:MAG: hypothetical protein AAFY88_01960 [Acidobacteriota bacterium]
MFTLRKTLLLGVTAALVLAGSSSAATQCARFDKIDHCAIGKATLQLANDGQFLAVSNLGQAGDDGVSSHFKGATTWKADMTMAGGYLGNVATFNAISNGFLTASAKLTLEPEGLVARASFTGADRPSAYTLEVLRDGVVVASFPGQTTASSVVLAPVDPHFPPISPIPFPIPSPWPWPCPPRPTFELLAAGNCAWGFNFDSEVTVQPAGRARAAVKGDEIRMVEDVPGPGHYPYTDFDTIETRTNGGILVITGESVSQ